MIEVFTRYIRALMASMPHLASPTAFDIGEARVVVLDLEDVAPSGGHQEDRQTELMYMLGRHILGRNMFLRPGYVRHVPARVVREDLCANADAAAWIFGLNLREARGDLWEGVARYHSMRGHLQDIYLAKALRAAQALKLEVRRDR